MQDMSTTDHASSTPSSPSTASVASRPGGELLLRRVVQAVSAVAALAGARLGYDFGIQIGGPPVGFLVAANGALFGWLMVGSLADQAQRWLRRRRQPQR
jgi:hypothetical protein